MVLRRSWEAGCVSAAKVRDDVGAWLEDHGTDTEKRRDILLAVGELTANAEEHGGDGPIDLQCVSSPPTIAVSVTNRAAPGAVPPTTKWRMPGPTAIRGRGLPVVAALARSVAVFYREGAVTIRATFAARRTAC